MLEISTYVHSLNQYQHLNHSAQFIIGYTYVTKVMKVVINPLYFVFSTLFSLILICVIHQFAFENVINRIFTFPILQITDEIGNNAIFILYYIK